MTGDSPLEVYGDQSVLCIINEVYCRTLREVKVRSLGSLCPRALQQCLELRETAQRHSPYLTMRLLKVGITSKHLPTFCKGLSQPPVSRN